jgi:phosphohistidine phosphatase
LRIYILRHGIAENVRPGGADADRALTREGKQNLRFVLERARQANVRPSLILTSPYKRAVETAAIAADLLGHTPKPVETNALVPSSSSTRLWKVISGAAETDLMLVGHEPLLSNLAAFLLDCPDLLVDLKKGALVRIDVEPGTSAPRGVLKWMLTPKLAGK